MAEEQNARLERMEKTQQELQESIMKNQEDMARVMEMIRTMMEKKKGIEEPEQKEDILLKQASIAPTGPVPPLQQAPIFTYPFGIQSVGQTSGSVPMIPTSGVNPTEVVNVPNLDDEKERAKLGIEVAATKESSEDRQKYELLEERLRAIEGVNILGNINASELSLVPGVEIPPKFKVPEFEKYDGTKCPATHVKMYCMKMAAHTQNEKLMIHCFQDSLTGSAARWYVRLDRNRIRSWKDLVTAFLDQYKHIMDMAPDRMALQIMERKPTETFSEYAQRWRDVALQVDPPLNEKEMSVLFVGTLKGTYHDRLLANVTKNFADLVLSGTMIESAIKSGKIEGGESSSTKKGSAGKEKEDETQALFQTNQPQPMYASYPAYQGYPLYYPPVVNNVAPSPYRYSPAPRPAFVQRRLSLNNQSNHQNDTRKPKPDVEKHQFDPIPMSYTQLYPQLLEQHLVAPVFVAPRQPPFPEWYDANAICEYHGGAGGHSLEDCIAFKKKVQSLMKSGILTFEETGDPNINANPPPNATTQGQK